MNEFVSAGCFTIYRNKGSVWVLLIHQTWNQETQGWVAPKGAIDINESPEKTAIRETKEETGVGEIKILQFLESSHYKFLYEGSTANKVVHWYLAEAKNKVLGESKLTTKEKQTLDKTKWFTLDEGIKNLKFENEKNILRLIKKILSSGANFSDTYSDKFTNQNMGHYSAEVTYYSQADIRPVEEKLLVIIPKDQRILDAACGPGRFAIQAAKKGFTIDGVDIAPKVVEMAAKIAKNKGLKNCRFYVADLTKLPFKDNSYSTTLCLRYSLNSIPTYEKRRAVVGELCRVTKPGGKIYIETQNMFYLGKGLGLPMTNIFVRYLYRYLNMFLCKVIGTRYNGLLPGDFVYSSGKITTAPAGYLHLPSIYELRGMMPAGANFEFKSTNQILNEGSFDPFKFWRYSIWIVITKK